MDRSGPKIGLFGGTFDPPHLAHLRVAEEVKEAFSLYEIWFIPAGYPPHKEREPLPFEDRLTMLTLATKNNPAFKVLDLERQAKPSYTLLTLQRLTTLFPGYHFYLLLGWDAFMEIETWWHYEEFLHYVDIIVFSRGVGPWKEAPLLVKQRALQIWGDRALERVTFLEVFPFPLSSTLIRALLKEKKSVRYLVPEEVFLYIEEKNLYREP